LAEALVGSSGAAAQEMVNLVVQVVALKALVEVSKLVVQELRGKETMVEIT
jgi:hypothetical protein